MRKYLYIAIAAIVILTQNAHGAPTMGIKSSTLVFTMWDIVTDKSYILDLEVKTLSLLFRIL